VHAIWRFTSFLTALLNRLLALAVSAALLHDILVLGPGSPSAESWLERAAQWISQHHGSVTVAAVLLLLLNLNVPQFLLFTLLHRPGRAFIESRTAGGHSRVALPAIQKALSATALQVPEIARSRIRVTKLSAHRYRVHIRYWVKDVHDAGSAAEHLRLILKKRFSDLVVLDARDRVEFDLDLAGIDGLDLKRMPRKTLLAPPPTDAGFKGPVYPVEHDSQ
jgi:hypothetical protein